MIARLAFAALEWLTAAVAVVAAVEAHATASLPLVALAGLAAIVAGLLRAIAFSRAAGRRLDAALIAAGLRPSSGREAR